MARGKRMSDDELADFLGLSKDSAVRKNLRANKPTQDESISAEAAQDDTDAKVQSGGRAKVTQALSSGRKSASSYLRGRGYAKGGKVSRDGCATKGKTKGRMI